MFKDRYKIVLCVNKWYAVKCKFWCIPIWITVDLTKTLEEAKQLIKLHKNRNKALYKE